MSAISENEKSILKIEGMREKLPFSVQVPPYMYFDLQIF